MLNVGLTGGIASGKSTVARMLVEKGAVLIDFDELTREVEEPDKPAWREIVFADPVKRMILNDIVHPAVFAEWRRRLAEIERRQPDAVVLSDIPLLIEAGLEKMVDLVLLVYIPPDEQIRRLMARNGFSREEAERRVSAQMPIVQKIPRADRVIRNEGSIEETTREVERIWEELRRKIQP